MVYIMIIRKCGAYTTLTLILTVISVRTGNQFNIICLTIVNYSYMLACVHIQGSKHWVPFHSATLVGVDLILFNCYWTLISRRVGRYVYCLELYIVILLRTELYYHQYFMRSKPWRQSLKFAWIKIFTNLGVRVEMYYLEGRCNTCYSHLKQLWTDVQLLMSVVVMEIDCMIS